MFLNTVFEPVLDIFRVVSVALIAWGDWHDPRVQQGVVPVKNVVGAVSKHPDWCFDGERVTE